MGVNGSVVLTPLGFRVQSALTAESHFISDKVGGVFDIQVFGVRKVSGTFIDTLLKHWKRALHFGFVCTCNMANVLPKDKGHVGVGVFADFSFD